MATTEYEEPAGPSERERVLAAFGQTVAKVTDTDSSLPLRVWVLLVTIGACLVTAPLPANVIGVVAVVALALSAPVRFRSH